MLKGHDIICISTSDWNMPWGSKQQIMTRLSVENRVLYVEYQASFLHLFLPSFLFSRLQKLMHNLNKISDNLFIFTPCPLLPFGYYFRNVNVINQRILLWQLRKVVKKTGFKNPLLWIYPPSAADLIGKLDASSTVYHCIADFSNEKTSRLRRRTVTSMERDLARQAKIILVLTEALCRKYRDVNREVYLFPSAVDENLFSPTLFVKKSEPDDLASLKKPRIGMVGYLDGNVLDTAALLYAAAVHPEWSFIFIGPRFRYFGKLKALLDRDNIYFLGEKENSKVPFYIKCLDVCIIPYVKNEFTNNVSPLKLYEYLAMGKPVVASNLPGLARFEGLVRLVSSKEDFVRGIELSLMDDNKELAYRRLDIARANSWKKRLQFVSRLIEQAKKSSS